MIVRDNFQMTKMLKKSFKDYKKEKNSGMVQSKTYKMNYSEGAASLKQLVKEN